MKVPGPAWLGIEEYALETKLGGRKIPVGVKGLAERTECKRIKKVEAVIVEEGIPCTRQRPWLVLGEWTTNGWKDGWPKQIYWVPP